MENDGVRSVCRKEIEENEMIEGAQVEEGECL